MSEIRGHLHFGSTVSEIEGTPWRVVVHWHRDRGQLIPAGIEVRCYQVPREEVDNFQGGQETPEHGHPVFDDGEQSRAVSSELIGKRIRWGQVLGDHAAKLSRLTGADAETPGPHHAGSAELLANVSALASGLTRATGQTYELVADLYREAQASEHRSRPAVYVLERLADGHGYPLSANNPSDRVKVRQWIGEARKRGHLPKSTANTTTRRNPR